MRHPVISGCLAAAFAVATAQADDRDNRSDGAVRTATPIKHLVVIFQENISYDHYFGTYPHAQNNPGETPFKASKRTPINNNLLTPLDVNHADAAALARLPGVGSGLAQRIVEERERRGRFDSPEALRYVLGMGPKKLAAIRPFITVRD